MNPISPEMLQALSVLKHEWNDLGWLEIALTHQSYFRKKERAHLQPEDDCNYQRLEFLGDAVLDLVLSKYLWSTFPNANEGELSKARSALVNESFLATIVDQLNLTPAIRVDQTLFSEGELGSSIKSDVYESICGALYIDGGYNAAENFILECYTEFIENRSISSILASLKDFKTTLQEYLQSRGQLPPTYELLETKGPEHKPQFEMAALVNNHVVGIGVAGSKKKAEQVAAQHALNLLKGKRI